MPRTKKNPVTDLPIATTESQPLSEAVSEKDQSNVIQINHNSQSSNDVDNPSRDWSDIDSILSSIVSFI